MAPEAEDPDAHLREHRLAGRVLLSGGFLEVHKDDVRLPDGSTATREYIRHPGAVAVVPLLDDGRIVLVRQHRYPIDRITLEFPAGKLDPAEAPIVCAMRELEEETGYTAREWAAGPEIHNAAAYSTESIWIFYARGLVAGPRRLDEGEFVETVVMSPAELDALAARGGLPDVKTHIGLAWLQRAQAGARPMAWKCAESARAATIPSR